MLMLLHELVDYNLFVPANMVYFAFLAGLYLHPYREPTAPKQRTKPVAESSAALSEQALRRVSLLPQAGEPGRNPFMD